MGQEPWLTYLTSIIYTETSRPIIESDKLVEDCLSRGIESERLFGHKEIELNAPSTQPQSDFVAFANKSLSNNLSLCL
jgi:hypothetical protein